MTDCNILFQVVSLDARLSLGLVFPLASVNRASIKDGVSTPPGSVGTASTKHCCTSTPSASVCDASTKDDVDVCYGSGLNHLRAGGDDCPVWSASGSTIIDGSSSKTSDNGTGTGTGNGDSPSSMLGERTREEHRLDLSCR
jgi:hypothetical protein